MKVIGIDLAGLAANPSGFSILKGRKFSTRLIYSDKQIIYLCAMEKPDIAAIDAPLSFPKIGNLRKADLSLIKRGLLVFPPTFGGMLSLTNRGINLAKKLRARRIRVIEIHPKTSGLILFKTDDRARWIAKLKRQGFRFEGCKSRHEIDSAMAALTGLLHLKHKTEEVGTRKEGTIIIPQV